MCFSATASFVAGAGLAITGLRSFAYTRTYSKRLLAMVPFCFGIQQISEGFVWRGMQTGYQPFVFYGSHIFLFFAFFFWPVWVPLAMRGIEPNKTRQALLSGLLILGLVIGCLLMYHISMDGFLVTMFDCHIKYIPQFDTTKLNGIVWYLFVTVAPFFISSHFLAKLMGCAVAIAYLVTHYFYTQVLISVWCFFAALISVFSIALIYHLKLKSSR